MSEFFIGRNDSLADSLLSPETLMKSAPETYGPRFDAIAELRAQDDGTLHRGNEFRRVASLVNVPMVNVLNLLDPEWMKDKRKFYAFLSRNPQYKTYDSRGGSKPTVTFWQGSQTV